MLTQHSSFYAKCELEQQKKSWMSQEPVGVVLKLW